MEIDKPLQRVLPPKPIISAQQLQWVQSLKKMVVNDACCLPTQRLIHDGEAPMNPLEYHEIISDLVRFGHVEILGIVLDHLPPDLTEIILTGRASKIDAERQRALTIIVAACASSW